MSTSTGASAAVPASALDIRTATAVRQNLARVTLAVLCLLLLVAGSPWVLRPYADDAARWVLGQAGSVGGLLSFGLVGLFIGPVVLAVSYTLVAAWSEEGLGEA